MTDLEKAIIATIEVRPFYGCLLSQLDRRLDEQLPTIAAVSVEPLTLIVNPALFSPLTLVQKINVLEHECCHVLWGHFLRIPADRWRWNIATDLCINDALVAGIPRSSHDECLPKGSVLPHLFELPSQKDAEFYYRALADNDRYHAYRKAYPDGDTSIDSHDLWDADPSVSVTLIEREVEDLVRETVEKVGAGKAPKWLLKKMEKGTSKSGISWRQALHRFASQHTNTAPYSTSRRRSKRYGTRPGLKIVDAPALTVALDTSGSIGPVEFSLFTAELCLMHRTGAAIKVVEFDTEVKRVYEFKKTLGDVVGGGGTDLTVPFAWKDRYMGHSGGLIVLTDGYGPVPGTPPSYPVLFVLSPGGRHPCRWGQAVWLK